MAEIPKLAQQALRQQHRYHHATHPDADLLTALAEGSLSAREREHVLAHLVECADCREVVALSGLAIREDVPVALPAHKVRRALWSWGPLRWTAAAATAVVVLSAVWLNHREQIPSEIRVSETNANVVQSPTPGANASQAGDLGSIKSGAQKDTAELGRQAEGLKSKAPERPAASTANESAKVGGVIGAISESRDEARANEEQPAIDNKDRYGFTTPVSRNDKRLDDKQALVNGSLIHTPVGGPMRSNEAGAAAQASAPARELSENKPAAAPSATPPQITMTYSRKAATDLEPANQVAEPQAEATSSAARQDRLSNVRVGPRATPLQIEQASAGKLEKAADASAMLWRVTGDGQLQQSIDSGRTWNIALGEHPSRFRAVAFAGTTVWAGGDDGALWSSFNNGQTWRKLAPNVDGHSLRGNVDSIRLIAPRTVTFRTSTGETWTTNDGGINWTVKYE